MPKGPSREEREAQRRAQEAQARLEEERRAAAERANVFINAANQPDELENRLRQRSLDWMDWESGTNGPRDVQNAPLGAGLDLYSNAVNRQQGERMGIGALRLGMNESNPMLSQLLNQQSQDMRQQEAAGGLERAVRLRSAEANQSALPLADFAQGRRMGLASLASGNANSLAGAAGNAMGNYLQFAGRPQRPSFWGQLIQGGIQAGMSKLQVGCMALDTLLLTPSGYTPIGDLNEGDTVIAVLTNGERVEKRIVNSRESESEILRIENTDGGIVEVSPSDRIMKSSDDHSETFASKLREDDVINGTKIKSVEKLAEKKKVKIIKVGNFAENFGLIDGAGYYHLDDGKTI